jgi:hypothetical protein
MLSSSRIPPPRRPDAAPREGLVMMLLLRACDNDCIRAWRRCRRGGRLARGGPSRRMKTMVVHRSRPTLPVERTTTAEMRALRATRTTNRPLRPRVRQCWHRRHRRAVSCTSCCCCCCHVDAVVPPTSTTMRSRERSRRHGETAGRDEERGSPSRSCTTRCGTFWRRERSQTEASYARWWFCFVEGIGFYLRVM